MKPTTQQLATMDALMTRWYEANRADYIANYGPARTLSNYESTRYTVGKNFFHLVIGSSSAFLVDIETGVIYGNKSWLKADRTKIVGNAYDPNFDATSLIRDRFRYGRFENNPAGSLRQQMVKR